MILVYLLALAVAVGYLRGGRLKGYLQKPLRGVVWPVAGFLIESSFAWLPARRSRPAFALAVACRRG